MMYIVQCGDGRFYRRGKLVASRMAASFRHSPSGAAGILIRAQRTFPDLQWEAVPFRENAPMPQTSKEKQEAFRARNAMLGLTEVRGVFLPPSLHADLKEQAKKLLTKHKPLEEPPAVRK